MSHWRNRLTVTLLLLCGAASSHASPHRRPTSGHKKKHASHVLHGQQAIDADRAKQIQTALIREHYMDGEATGVWDDRSKNAMLKYQADNGWQTKVTPDSRAIIKLGLGPTEASGETTPVPAGPHATAAAATTAPADPKPQPHTLGSAISQHSSTTQNFAQPQ